MKLPDTLNSNEYAELMCFFDGYNVLIVDPYFVLSHHIRRVSNSEG